MKFFFLLIMFIIFNKIFLKEITQLKKNNIKETTENHSHLLIIFYQKCKFLYFK
jgi:hypothetical protein